MPRLTISKDLIPTLLEYLLSYPKLGALAGISKAWEGAVKNIQDKLYGLPVCTYGLMIITEDPEKTTTHTIPQDNDTICLYQNNLYIFYAKTQKYVKILFNERSPLHPRDYSAACDELKKKCTSFYQIANKDTIKLIHTVIGTPMPEHFLHLHHLFTIPSFTNLTTRTTSYNRLMVLNEPLTYKVMDSTHSVMIQKPNTHTEAITDSVESAHHEAPLIDYFKYFPHILKEIKEQKELKEEGAVVALTQEEIPVKDLRVLHTLLLLLAHKLAPEQSTAFLKNSIFIVQNRTPTQPLTYSYLKFLLYPDELTRVCSDPENRDITALVLNTKELRSKLPPKELMNHFQYLRYKLSKDKWGACSGLGLFLVTSGLIGLGIFGVILGINLAGAITLIVLGAVATSVGAFVVGKTIKKYLDTPTVVTLFEKNKNKSPRFFADLSAEPKQTTEPVEDAPKIR